MKAILQNPYRTLGLLAGATAREQVKHANKLKKYIEAEQEPEKDFSFPVLGKIQRTVDGVEEAYSRLMRDVDKINAALFWFCNGNDITDEPALEALKDGDITAAYQIWDKLITESKTDDKSQTEDQVFQLSLITEATTDSSRSPHRTKYSKSLKNITERNWSAFHNCFVLNMLWVNGNKSHAIAENLYFLESKFCQKFVSMITGSTFKITSEELQLDFLNEVLQEIDQGTVSLTQSEFVKILKSVSFSAREAFITGFVSKKVEYIETVIKETKEKRRTVAQLAANAGNNLLEATRNELVLIKLAVGINNIKYSSIADKVANEILQCGIGYFSHYRDSNKDPSKITMDLFEKAGRLATGDYAKERCQEHTENLQEWIDEKPERDKLKEIESDITFITAALERFQNLDTVANARELVDGCKPKLISIKNKLGSTNDFYLQISSVVVGHVQAMIISVVNETQESLRFHLISLSDLEEIVNKAYNVLLSIDSMDMDSNLKLQYLINRKTLAGIRSQILQVNSARTSRSSGCYIATMVYGDYDHPQVLILRQFRDDVLNKYIWGQWFIKTYYRYSSQLVEHLKDRKAVNTVIRSILNQFIKIIAK